MRRWHVSMTFEGYVEADNANGASAAFKTKLGLPPASMRPECHITGMAAREVDADGRDVGLGTIEVSTESHVVRIPGEPDGT